MMRPLKKKTKIKKRRRMIKRMWDEFGRRMNVKVYYNMSEMNSVMDREGGDLGEQDNWQEDRG